MNPLPSPACEKPVNAYTKKYTLKNPENPVNPVK